MKAILNIVAIVLAAGGIFYSFDLLGKFKAEQQDRLAAVASNNSVVADREAVSAELQKEEAALQAASDERTAAEQAVSSLKSAGASLQRDLDAQDTLIKTQTAEFDQLNKTIESMRSAVAVLGADLTLENLPDKVKELANKRTELEAKSTEVLALVQAGTSRRESQKEETDRLAEVKTKRDNRIKANSLETVVTAVSQEWGFVIVGAGLNTGFTPQTKLLIERDGRLIGKVQPTSIEANQTLADIDFDSLAPGVRIQTGDRVILADPAAN